MHISSGPTCDGIVLVDVSLDVHWAAVHALGIIGRERP